MHKNSGYLMRTLRSKLENEKNKNQFIEIARLFHKRE